MRNSRNRIVFGVLNAVAYAGLIGITLVAPNVLGAFLKLHSIQKKKIGYYIPSVVRRLEWQGLLASVQKNGHQFLRLTPKGERILERLRIVSGSLRQKRWDGKWRVVIFDVRENRKGTRERIRRDLLSFGFKRLQDSVWVYPFPCEAVVKLLKADHHIGREVLFVLAESIENERWLMDEFVVTK